GETAGRDRRRRAAPAIGRSAVRLKFRGRRHGSGIRLTADSAPRIQGSVERKACMYRRTSDSFVMNTKWLAPGIAITCAEGTAFSIARCCRLVNAWSSAE